MNIGILGTGSVGQALAGKLAALGHQVVIGTRNVAETLARTTPDGWGNPAIGAWALEHPEVRIVTFEEAAAFSDQLLIHAMNGRAAISSLQMAGEKNLNGKILVDITNPLDFSNGFPPSLFVSNTDSLGEQIQTAFPQLKVVKTLNTMSNPVMINPAAVPGNHCVFLSGNDEEAKAAVSQMLATFGWKTEQMIDLGDISTARGTEQLLPVWVRLYGKLKTPMFNFSIHLAQ